MLYTAVYTQECWICMLAASGILVVHLYIKRRAKKSSKGTDGHCVYHEWNLRIITRFCSYEICKVIKRQWQIRHFMSCVPFWILYNIIQYALVIICYIYCYVFPWINCYIAQSHRTYVKSSRSSTSFEIFLVHYILVA